MRLNLSDKGSYHCAQLAICLCAAEVSHCLAAMLEVSNYQYHKAYREASPTDA